MTPQAYLIRDGMTDVNGMLSVGEIILYSFQNIFDRYYSIYYNYGKLN